MKITDNRNFKFGVLFIAAFGVWTALIKFADVQPLGPNNTDIGFAMLNCWFHCVTGVHMELYTITDWLGLVPIAVCLVFAGVGLAQLIKRKSLYMVDSDILVLGAYFAVTIMAYLIFEMIPINYRPVLINDKLEASYPSSTVLLVLCVMPAMLEQTQRRLNSDAAKGIILIAAISFSAFMTVGRLISGVHWLTDIVGAVLLSAGLFNVYKAAVTITGKKI